MTTALSGKPTFGAGRVFAIGNYTNPTAARMLVPQSQSIDFKRKVESLFGENQLAVAVGAGEMEVTGKVEYGKTVARIMADIMFAAGSAVGSTLEAEKEAGTVPAATPFTITVVNSTTWSLALDVVNATTGVPYTCVAGGSEVAGKSYSVAAGVYKFAAGDAGLPMQISYAYTSATAGETVSMNNVLQGLTGSFEAVHVLPWGAEQDMFVFYSCIASSSSLSAKKSGFGTQTLDYSAFVNGNGSLGIASFAETS